MLRRYENGRGAPNGFFAPRASQRSLNQSLKISGHSRCCNLLLSAVNLWRSRHIGSIKTITIHHTGQGGTVRSGFGERL